VTAVFAALAMLAPEGDLRAQDGRDWNNASDPLDGAVGLHYGRVAGHGLSFRTPLQWFFYVQPTFGIWHTSEREQHNFGLALHYVLRQDRLMRFYLGAGLAYFYDREMVGTEDGREIWEKRTDWNKGAGIGIERLLSRRVALQVEADFVHYGESGDIKVAPQLGLYYYW
jgi:hypothetical protein